MKPITLFIWIGAQAIRGGYAVGAQWDVDQFVDEPIEPNQTNGARQLALLQALSRLTQRMATRSEGVSHRPVARLCVAVADVHVSIATLPWSPLIMRADMARAMAIGQLVQSGLYTQADDVVRIDDGAYGMPRLVVAFPRALLDACHGLGRAVGASVESVLPVSVLAWQWAAAVRQLELPVMGVLTSGMSLLLLGNRRLIEVRVRRAEDAYTALIQHWQRFRLRDMGSLREGKLPILDLRCMRDGRAHFDGAQIESVSMPVVPHLIEPGWAVLMAVASGPRLALNGIELPPRRPKAMVLMALVCAALLAGGLMLDAWQTQRDRRYLDAAAQSQELAKHNAGPAVRSWTKEERAQAVVINDAVSRLNLPMEILLDALKPPKDIKVSVLSVDVRPALVNGHAVSLIQAQAESGQDMARYVAFVAQHAPFSAAYLKQHELVDSEPLHPYRFQMEAVWTTQ